MDNVFNIFESNPLNSHQRTRAYEADLFDGELTIRKFVNYVMMFILEYLYNCVICVLYLFMLLLVYQIMVYIVQILGIGHWFYDRRRRRYIGFVSVIIDYF